MDLEQYNNIFNYLTQKQYPSNFNQHQKHKLTNQASNYEIKNNFIYKKDKRKSNNLLRVIRRHEIEPVLFMFHNDPTAAHFAVDAMFEKIRTRYYWPQMYENIRTYVKSCDNCQRRGKNQRNQTLHSIPVNSPFYQIGIDFVRPL